METITFHRSRDFFVTNSSVKTSSSEATDYMECFRLNIFNNDIVEGNKTVVMGLARPTGAITLDPKRKDSQATITVVDDDRKSVPPILYRT